MHPRRIQVGRHQVDSERGAVSVRLLAAAAGAGLLVLTLALFRDSFSGGRKADEPPIVRLVDRTNLVLEAGKLRLKAGGEPFSGEMVEYHPGGGLRSSSVVSNGLLHGPSRGWFTNAQIQVLEHFSHGVSHGTRTKWYPGGAKLSEAAIVEGKLHGTFRRWHENGTLAETVEFVDGRAEGVSTAYFPSGFLKARAVTDAGKPIEQTFWNDGEKRP